MIATGTRLDNETLDWLKKQAKSKGQSISTILRSIVRDEMQRQKR